MAEPEGLMRLSELCGDREAVSQFTAWLGGREYQVTAVLERTAVIAPLDDRWGERRQAALEALWVDPETVVTRPRVPRRWVSGPSAPAAVGEVRRQESDQRAPASQQVARPPRSRPGRRPRPPAAPRPAAAPTTAPDREPRTCGRCGRRLYSHNQSGLCVPCQQVCPHCGRPKAIRAAACMRCASVVRAAARVVGQLASPPPGRSEDPRGSDDSLTGCQAIQEHARALERELASVQRQVARLQRRAAAALTPSPGRDPSIAASNRGVEHAAAGPDGDVGRRGRHDD